jgi:hypothetical protein
MPATFTTGLEPLTKNTRGNHEIFTSTFTTDISLYHPFGCPAYAFVACL